MKKTSTKPDPAPIRIGIIGLGRAGFGMQTQELLARKDKYEIVAGCDIDAKHLKRFAAAAPGAKTYRQAADLIADPNVDMVSVATRTPSHVDLSIDALKAGKLVMCEKPIAVDFASAKKLWTVARRRPGKLFIRQNRRFEAAFNDIEEIVRSGILGDVYEIKLRRHSYSRRNDWQTVIAEGGGQLLNWGPHIVDHALQLLGSPLASITSDLKRVAAVGDAEDHVHLLLRGKNGRHVEIEISGGVAIAEPVYWIAGTKGTLVSRNEKTIELKYLDPAKKLPARRVTLALMDGFGAPDKLEWKEETRDVRKDIDTTHIWDNVFDHIRNGAPLRVKLEEAMEVMRVLTLARDAAAAKKQRRGVGG
ncbi:MAG: Gfo/Idh/MocA family protein [Kiritimatiellia bacterium]|jgi:scyllo-inositol 2-dehydrogenase (NADP+)